MNEVAQFVVSTFTVEYMSYVHLMFYDTVIYQNFFIYDRARAMHPAENDSIHPTVN